MSNDSSNAVDAFLPMLRCPVSGEALHRDGDQLISVRGRYSYPLTASGIPLFMGDYFSPEAVIQQGHYDRVAVNYVENFTYPHTQAYMDYLDGALRQHMQDAQWGSVVEICCGHGEAFAIFGQQVQQGIGVDVSRAMLEHARHSLPDPEFLFLQGDATILPLQDRKFDTVIMLGGIHHVNNRAALFQEIHRLLKDDGKFYWREPVSDFILWRFLRAIVYRLAPSLEADTEHPLHYDSTVKALSEAGFEVTTWQTYGLLGFMIFMNSDVMVLNRWFRFIPGIRHIVRLSTRLDDWILRLPGLSRYGLQVIGCARKKNTAS